MSLFDTHVERLARAIRQRGILRTGAQVARIILFPKGSRRDKAYARWLRPVVFAATGAPLVRPVPTPDIVTWTSPATHLLGTQQRVRTILVTKVDHIGDFLLALPALAQLRRNFPKAAITLICGTWNVGLATRSGLFDTIIPLDFFSSQSDAARRPRLDANAMAAMNLPIFDLAIDLRVDEDTRLLLGHVTARCKAGYFSRLMPSDMAIVLPLPPIHPPDTSGILPHQRNLMMQLVSAVIASLDPLADGQRLLERLGSEHADAAAEMRRDWRGPVVVVNTSSGREVKNWPLENFISVCRWIGKDLGGTVVLVGGPAQKREAAQIARKMRPGSLVNLVATIPLEQTMAVIKRADLFLGNDSGLTHAAAMMAVPTVALYSGIDPIATWGPLGPNVTAIKAKAACAPCHLTHITDCRYGHICMRAIPVDTVKHIILRHLGPNHTTLLLTGPEAPGPKALAGACPAQPCPPA